MAVYTFSTKDKTRPQDTELVDRIKKRHDDSNRNFSALIVELLRKWEQTNGRA